MFYSHTEFAFRDSGRKFCGRQKYLKYFTTGNIGTLLETERQEWYLVRGRNTKNILQGYKWYLEGGRNTKSILQGVGTEFGWRKKYQKYFTEAGMVSGWR